MTSCFVGFSQQFVICYSVCIRSYKIALDDPQGSADFFLYKPSATVTGVSTAMNIH